MTFLWTSNPSVFILYRSSSLSILLFSLTSSLLLNFSSINLKFRPAERSYYIWFSWVLKSKVPAFFFSFWGEKSLGVLDPLFCKRGDFPGMASLVSSKRFLLSSSSPPCLSSSSICWVLGPPMRLSLSPGSVLRFESLSSYIEASWFIKATLLSNWDLPGSSNKKEGSF